MIIAIVIPVFALFGLSLNLAFSNVMAQPDWALALLLASILAHRNNWIWVLPCALLHDLVLYWSFGMVVIVLALIPLAMIYLDQRLGVGLPQRVLLMLAAVLVLPVSGWSLQACVLTLCLCVPVWYVLTRQYEREQRTA